MKPYYADDYATLYHGDCREVLDWLHADVLITDPPYGMNAALTRTAIDVPIAGDHDTSLRDEVLALWGHRPAIVFGHWRKDRPRGVTHLAVWDKVHMGARGEDVAVRHEPRGDLPTRRPGMVARSEAHRPAVP